jgi:hypothetical protein
MQIKTFEGNGNNEVMVNEWLAKNSNIEIINIFYSPMYDVQYYVPPAVCNYWIITTVVYKEVK